METLDASLHRHLHEISDLLRRLLLHPVCDVGVGIQRKSRGEMAQHLGQGFDVHAILQCQRGEGVPQIVEPDGLDSSLLQDLTVNPGGRVRVVHGAGYR